MSSPLKTFPDSFSNLKNITALSLEGLNLSKYPIMINEMTDMKSINLSLNPNLSLEETINNLSENNNIVEFAFNNNNVYSIPDNISDMKSLQILCLAGNTLDKISSSIFKLYKLERLVLSHNSIDTIPEGIEKLKDLHEFDVRGNWILHISEKLYELDKPKFCLYLNLINNEDYNTLKENMPSSKIIK